MTDDQLFRLILLGGAVVLLPIGIYHRLKSRTDEPLNRREEGLFILIALRLTGIVGWAGFMAYLINPAWMAWAALPLPVWVRWIGVGFFAITGWLFVWTFRGLGKNLTDTVVTRQAHTLVTIGPYRLVRHPLYTAAGLATLAVPLASANAFIFVTGFVIMVLLVIRTRKEEANLIARFGDDYRNYMRRTGRFLPRPLHRILMTCGLLMIVVAGHFVLNRLFAFRNAASVYTIHTPAADPAVGFDGTLRLASYNIAHGRGTNHDNFSSRPERQERLKDIAELLRKHDVDIAVLNEVDFAAVWTGHENQAKIIAREAGFAHVIEQRNFDLAIPFLRLRFGNAILSRFPIKSAQFVPLPALSRSEWRVAGAKQGVTADIQVDDQLTIRVFAVHLDWRDEATRSRSAAVIATCATNSPLPFFALGDFNCSTSAREETQSTSSKTTALDLLLKISRLKTFPTGRPSTAELTYASYSPSDAIDWVLIPSDWEFLSHKVSAVQLSDHRPVFVEVRKPGAGPIR